MLYWLWGKQVVSFGPISIAWGCVLTAVRFALTCAPSNCAFARCTCYWFLQMYRCQIKNKPSDTNCIGKGQPTQEVVDFCRNNCTGDCQLSGHQGGHGKPADFVATWIASPKKIFVWTVSTHKSKFYTLLGINLWHFPLLYLFRYNLTKKHIFIPKWVYRDYSSEHNKRKTQTNRPNSTGPRFEIGARFTFG